MDDAKGNLAAKGKVASTLMLEQTRREDEGDRADADDRGAGEMLYEDGAAPRDIHRRRARRRAAGRPAGARKIELYLKARGNELDRVEAYTTVTLQDAIATASGERLTYSAADGRYVVLGSPGEDRGRLPRDDGADFDILQVDQ